MKNFLQNKLAKSVKVLYTLAFLVFLFLLVSCSKNSKLANEVNINIISTSDVHGKLLAYDYELNKEDKSGSLAQISTCIKNLRNERTILIDLGDLIQGNSADFFLDDDIHPMIYAENLMKYDVSVLGNHEFDFGMDTVRKVINTHDNDVLCANVFYENGECIAKPYVIIEKQGVKIGIIGVVTSDIQYTNKDLLKKENIIVKDPIEEVKNIAKEIRNDVDVLIAACHIGLNIDYAGSDVDVANIALNDPNVDLILAAHTHMKLESEYRNNILITENLDGGKTLSKIDIDMLNNNGKYKIVDMRSKSYEMKDYEEDTFITKNEKIIEADKKIKDSINRTIARLKNKNLTDDNDINGVPIARLRDTALTRLINDALMYYSGAEISATGLYKDNSNLYEGDIKKSDMYNLYLYDNTLYKLKMKGSQIKKWIESSSDYFNIYKDGDENISVNAHYSKNAYYIFGGLKYNIDIRKEVGERVNNLTLLNGEVLEMDKYYTVATNNYIANTKLLKPNVIFNEEDGIPILLEKDISGDRSDRTDILGDKKDISNISDKDDVSDIVEKNDITNIRDLIYEYIINVKGVRAPDGIVDLEVEDVTESNANWKVIW